MLAVCFSELQITRSLRRATASVSGGHATLAGTTLNNVAVSGLSSITDRAQLGLFVEEPLDAYRQLNPDDESVLALMLPFSFQSFASTAGKTICSSNTTGRCTWP